MSVAVLLSGGGARGALQVGAIERVASRADVWVGTSVGAINAAAGAARRVHRARALWESVDGIGTFQAPNIDVWNGLYQLRPLERLMRDEGMLQPRLPLYVGVFDLATCVHELVQATGEPEKVWECIRASSSIPVQHEAVKLRGRWTADGGIDSPLPPVPPGDWDEIHAVFCTPIDDPLPILEQDEVSSALEQAHRALDHVVAMSVRRCCANLVEYGRRHPGTKIWVYEPARWSVVGPSFDAAPETIRRRLEHGDWMAQHPVLL